MYYYFANAKDVSVALEGIPVVLIDDVVDVTNANAARSPRTSRAGNIAEEDIIETVEQMSHSRKLCVVTPHRNEHDAYRRLFLEAAPLYDVLIHHFYLSTQ